MPIINPNWKPHVDLGFTDAEWDALKAVITDYMDANAGSNEVDTAAVRVLDAEFVDDRVWAQVTADTGLSLVQDPE